MGVRPWRGGDASLRLTRVENPSLGGERLSETFPTNVDSRALRLSTSKFFVRCTVEVDG